MLFASSSPAVDLQLVSEERPINSHRQDDFLDLSAERCGLQVHGVSRSGACDQIECGGKSSVVCESEDCCNCPCERHMKLCPCCRRNFCESSDKTLWTCFFEHVQEEKCKEEILRVRFSGLAHAFESGQHGELAAFVNRDSDGLGHPLPKDVCINLGLAVAYSNNTIPDYNEDVLIARKLNNRSLRTRQPRLRRAAKRLGDSVTAPSFAATRLAPHRNSTIHLVTGALVVRHWTGGRHYREQIEILGIMGLSKSEDFVRDRIDYLRGSNPMMFKKIESWATAMKKWR
jgi:hypothetical protein